MESHFLRSNQDYCPSCGHLFIGKFAVNVGKSIHPWIMSLKIMKVNFTKFCKLVSLFISVFTIIGLSTTCSYGQKKSIKADYYQQQANHFASIKQYKQAAWAFLLESKVHKMIPYKKNATGNAAYCYALADMPDSALACLVTSTHKYGFRNLDWLITAPILNEVRKLKGYSELKQELTQLNTQNNPDKAQIITSDINLFWKVYDQYRKDTANAESLFLTGYFEKGSLGLQEYYRLKTPNIGGIKGFVRNIKTMPGFYTSIRRNSLQVQSLADTVKNIYRQLKYWYPESNFPNTTFVIGGWSSGGTATEYGSLVGADMQTADSSTITQELSRWKKNNLIPFTGMKYVVAHELIHVQQSEMASDTTLLNFAIREGMADFIGEIISGKTANERLKLWAKGKERQIWADFQKEMYLNRYANWIGNSEQDTPDRPADLGYWVGYQICKAYFDNSADKRQAITDMLHIKDYRRFLADSKVEDQL